MYRRLTRRKTWGYSAMANKAGIGMIIGVLLLLVGALLPGAGILAIIGLITVVICTGVIIKILVQAGYIP